MNDNSSNSLKEIRDKVYSVYKTVLAKKHFGKTVKSKIMEDLAWAYVELDILTRDKSNTEQ